MAFDKYAVGHEIRGSFYGVNIPFEEVISLAQQSTSKDGLNILGRILVSRDGRAATIPMSESHISVSEDFIDRMRVIRYQIQSCSNHNGIGDGRDSYKFMFNQLNPILSQYSEFNVPVQEKLIRYPGQHGLDLKVEEYKRGLDIGDDVSLVLLGIPKEVITDNKEFERKFRIYLSRLGLTKEEPVINTFEPCGGTFLQLSETEHSVPNKSKWYERNCHTYWEFGTERSPESGSAYFKLRNPNNQIGNEPVLIEQLFRPEQIYVISSQKGVQTGIPKRKEEPELIPAA